MWLLYTYAGQCTLQHAKNVQPEVRCFIADAFGAQKA